jgi:hypothetical protein
VPTGIDLLPAFDSGASDADHLTSQTLPGWRVSLPAGVNVGDRVRLYSANTTAASYNFATVTLGAADLVAGYVDIVPANASSLNLAGASYLEFSRNEAETNVSREIVFRTTAGGGLFGVQSGGSVDRTLWITADGNVGSYVYGNGTPASNVSETRVSTGLNLTDGREHRLLFTLGPAGTKVYVDGTLVLTGTRTASDYNLDTTQRLGANNASSFNGEILSYTSWGTQLSAAQVAGTAARPAPTNSFAFASDTATDSGSAPASNVTAVGTRLFYVAPGTYISAVSARIEDLSGNLSGPRLLSTLTVDTTAPAAPTVSLLAADDRGSLNNDNLTSRNTGFTLTGSVGANTASRIDIYLGTVLLGSTTVVGAASTWSWTYTGSALADGIHGLSARAVDAAGNVSATARRWR